MRSFSFEKNACDDLYWRINNHQPKSLKKIFELIQVTCNTPFEGIGKPEPLKGNFKGFWSRQITDEHRLIYKVCDEKIIIAGLKGHYQ